MECKRLRVQINKKFPCFRKYYYLIYQYISSHHFELRAFKYIFYRPMKCSDSHDILFAREVLVSSLYETRNGSPERGKVWNEIAENLNKLESPKFHVSKRSLRDRLNLLINRYKAKVREEDLASGISPDDDELSSMLEEICDKEEEWMHNPPCESKRKKAEQDKVTAEEMRKKAMETVGETKKKE
jgi:hypothetical protein